MNERSQMAPIPETDTDHPNFPYFILHEFALIQAAQIRLEKLLQELIVRQGLVVDAATTVLLDHEFVQLSAKGVLERWSEYRDCDPQEDPNPTSVQ